MKKYAIGIMALGILVVYSIGIRHQQPKIIPSSAATTSGSGMPPTNDSSSSNTSQTSTTGTYKDGTYTGTTEDAYYGKVQVQARISGGKITDVTFLQYPNTHSTSVYINRQAMPYLQQETIKAQSASVNVVSGATYTSQAFIKSLSNALSQA